ncbi:MAG: N-acetylmuramoyl-L-alanine amidase [Sediminibacterium sp.]|nr:MAG: N-acetylmuramoyl-L-alanine amidase [Sediminibacterium sp.]
MRVYFFSYLLLVGLSLSAQQSQPKMLIGRSTGKLPSMVYSLGEDRLGAAKLGYIDTNIVLRVVDSTKELYKVQLSKYHSAYIDKAYFKVDSSIQLKPFYLTSSYLAKGDTLYDVVNIRVDEHLPYKSWMEISPSKIMIDIYGVQANTNWITQLQSLKEVKNVYYNQVEDDVVRVTIELKHQQHWGYSIAYKGKSLSVHIKRQPSILELKNMVIAIDAGHGGTNSGAEGIKHHASEKENTLLYAKALEKSLKKLGVKKVIMTRNIDTSFDMKDRILFLQQQNPDFLISLHFNSSDNESVQGVSTFYKYIGFRPLSQHLLKRMLELKLNEFGNIGNFNFGLNSPTDFPNALVEIAFLSNIEDEKKIISPKFRLDVAKKISLGIQDWLKQLQ